MSPVAEYKKKTVQEIVDLSKEYPIIGIVNMENLPAQQLQSMRSELRDKVSIYMTKKTFMRIALEKIKADKSHIEELEKHFEGMPALIFTKDSPFRLSSILKKSKTPAPAKSGQTAPNDIVVPAGPTPFAPGPVISELSSAGLDVGVESGKVAVKKDSVVAKKGEKITQKVAEVLTRLDIKPMEVGLDLVAAYDDGIIYLKDILDVDEQEYLDNVNLAAMQGFNLAFNTAYITKDNAPLLVGKAFTEAKALGLSQDIIDSGIIDELLGKAERSMLNLKSTANIETMEKPKEEAKEEKLEAAEPKPETTEEKPTEQPKEEKETEKSIEEKKPEVKQEGAKAEVKEEKKVEEKTEAPKEEPKQETPKPEEKLQSQPETVPEKTPEPEVKEEAPQTPEPQPEVKEQPAKPEIDKKVEQMVQQTKKFAEGKEESASDIIEEVKKEEIQEKEVPISQEPKKEEPTEDKEVEEKKKKDEDEQKEVEDLAKELVKKGTLRK